MPIFDCKCEECGCEKEVLTQSLREEHCDCGGAWTILWVSTCRFEFKTQGFFHTDYGNGCCRLA